MKRNSFVFVVAFLTLSACKPQKAPPPAESIATQIKAADARMAAAAFDDARARFQAIIQQDPNNSEAHRGLGQVAIYQSDFQGSLPHLQKAIALNDKNAEAHAALGSAQQKLSQFAAAAGSYQKASALAPDESEWALLYGQNLRLAKKLPEAEKVLSELSKRDPDVHYVYTELGDTQRAAGKLDDALRSYMKGQSQHASDKGAWAGAAEVYEAKGETTLALNEWAEYIRRDCCSEFSNKVAKPRLAKLKAKEEAGS